VKANPVKHRVRKHSRFGAIGPLMRESTKMNKIFFARRRETHVKKLPNGTPESCFRVFNQGSTA
jgi:hypothetical protein